jgi:hypothetical protein
MTNTKKKHGNKMKLMSAIGMLTVSAAMLVSSTFAWFSMNKTVRASTMNISATSANPYLVISESQTGTFDTNADAMVISPAAATELKLVTPLNVASNVAYYANATDKATPTTTTPSKFTNASSVLWGTTISSDPSAAQGTNVTDLVGGTGFDNGTLADYAQTSELWFKVLGNAAANGGKGENLTFTNVTFTNENGNTVAASGRVLLVSETGKYQLIKFKNGTVDKTAAADATYFSGDAALLAEVTTTPAKITAYFYFDGTDTDAYTNNATNLSGITASFTFAVD